MADDDDNDDSGGDGVMVVMVRITFPVYRLGNEAIVCAELKFILTPKPTFFSLYSFSLCVLIVIAWSKRA